MVESARCRRIRQNWNNANRALDRARRQDWRQTARIERELQPEIWRRKQQLQELRFAEGALSGIPASRAVIRILQALGETTVQAAISRLDAMVRRLESELSRELGSRSRTRTQIRNAQEDLARLQRDAETSECSLF